MNDTARTAAIATMMQEMKDTRAQIEALDFPIGAFVICSTETTISSLSIDDAGTVKFKFTNTPRAFNAQMAHHHAKRWNAVHGKEHPVHVLPGAEWKAQRLAENDATEKLWSDLSGVSIDR